MLSRLSIQNYAIIDELEIVFSEHLNVITGETGAGKSIIVGALGLILGERADSSALVNKNRKCIVEGVFEHDGKKAIHEFLKIIDVDIERELMVRREINVNGKSRAFINDTPVSLVQLNELSGLLVDLHHQFDTQDVGESVFQRQVLDALAGHTSLVEEYQALFKKSQLVKKEWEDLKDQKLQFEKEADYHQFQYDELKEAGFKENELEDIDAELKMLSNAEGIKGALNNVYVVLSENENPIAQQLKSLWQQLKPLAGYHPEIPELLQRLENSRIEIQDIGDDADRISSHVKFDPAEIEILNERLSLGYRLQKKHGVQTTAELLNLQKELEEKLRSVLNLDDMIQAKEKEMNLLLTNATELAANISKGRIRQIKPLQDKVNKLLTRVGMPNAKLKAEVLPGELNISGMDTIEFLFNANLTPSEAANTERYQPVRKVASGGELSRLMLCIKSLVAQSVDMPALIFDEIDTGISGEAARQVGLIMKELAANRQVICITHQPQIAGKADAHYFVFKEIVNDTVKTNIRLLTMEERITTIAQMLSGEKPTAAALANAREMVKN
jgi:DNA repair protein RecN (Recombination protein N)